LCVEQELSSRESGAFVMVGSRLERPIEQSEIRRVREWQPPDVSSGDPAKLVVFVGRTVLVTAVVMVDQPDRELEVEILVAQRAERGSVGGEITTPSSSRSSRAPAEGRVSPDSTWPPARSHTSGYQARSERR
jgi:hypothetical protein